MNGISMVKSSLFSECSFYRLLFLHDGCGIISYLSETMNDSYFKVVFSLHTLFSPSYYFFFFKFIYLVYFWLRGVFVARADFSLVAASRGYSSLQ